MTRQYQSQSAFDEEAQVASVLATYGSDSDRQAAKELLGKLARDRNVHGQAAAASAVRKGGLKHKS